VAIERLRKDDGRALILYSRAGGERGGSDGGDAGGRGGDAGGRGGDAGGREP
jgi:hypothetical protein